MQFFLNKRNKLSKSLLSKYGQKPRFNAYLLFPKLLHNAFINFIIFEL